VIFTPTAALLYYRQCRPKEERGDINTMTYTYFAVGTLGLAIVGLAQAGLAFGLARVLFGSHTREYMREFLRSDFEALGAEVLQRRASITSSWQHYVFLFLLNWPMATLDEMLKYNPIAIVRRQKDASRTISTSARKRQYLQYSTAAALGFATMENIAFAMGKQPLLTVLERTIVSVPGHVLCACAAAINAAELHDSNDASPFRKLWRILQQAMIFHGAWNPTLFSLCGVMDGNVGWVNPTNPKTIAVILAAIVGLQTSLGRPVWRRWKETEGEKRD
jgi:RsiW-degrading membrane proteinase PrsW (M82 family)